MFVKVRRLGFFWGTSAVRWRGHLWRVLASMVGLWAGSFAWAAGVAIGEPRILGIEHRGLEWQVRVSVPPGVARVVLEGCRRDDLRAWIPKATARVAPQETELTFSLEPDPRMEMFRVRVDAEDPLPAAWYSGATQFPAEPADDNEGLIRSPAEDALAAVDTGAGGAGSVREVMESDIWAIRGDTLYFFNALRGLQWIDLKTPGAPELRGTFRLPGSGEQMYLAGDRHVVLLVHDPCRQWGTDAESAIVVVDTGGASAVEAARLPLQGRIVESRWVGTALYVATETWESVNDGSGSWRAGTRVASFDFSIPSNPVARGNLWIPGAGSVVAATDRFLFVAVTDYSTLWPWKTDLEVLDITAEDGSLATWVRLPLEGRIPDKDKIDLLGDTLRVVLEAVESPRVWRFVTVLQTYQLSDPRSATPLPVVPLDRLELARGERLFATRFDGTRGYVVTFERVDPLWVIDLSDPRDLRVAGEVEIPGWSTYLRPMGDRLLTLGVDDATGSRVAVQLFDVSDPAQPSLLAKVPLGDDASWSEANSDEKAFGVFPEAGLLLVPVSEWKRTGGEHGVQLLDFGPETITRRGFLKSDSVVPRRATLHRDQLVTLSGRSLVSADLGDRDEPRVMASVELAYPVERVLAVGQHILEFQGGTVRVRRSDSVKDSWSVALGDLPLLGAMERGGLVYLLQGRGAEVKWEYDTGLATWNGWTNTGIAVASVWDAKALPTLRKLGESRRETDRVGLAEDVEGHWLSDGLLLWSTTSDTTTPWIRSSGVADGGAAVDSLVGVGGGAWRPWQNDGGRTLTAVDVSDPGAPVIRSVLTLGAGDASVGKMARFGTLMYSSRRITESEVVGTNQVVETAWFPAPPFVETQVVTGADGSTITNVVVRNAGEWRAVSNSYPVVRWWSRYALDVVDYGPDPSLPVVRPPVSVPGALEGIARGGALVLTAGWTATADGSDVALLEAGAYDGVAVHRIDSVVVAEAKRSETYAIAIRDGVAHVARGGWGPEATQRLETWSLGDSGKWSRGAVATLGMVPGALRWFGNVLLARTLGGLELFKDGPGPELVELPALEAPGCYVGALEHGDGDEARGVWLPLGDYGAVRVGP